MYVKKKLSTVLLVAIMLSLIACSSDKDTVVNEVENTGSINENNTQTGNKNQIDNQIEEIEMNSPEETIVDDEKEETNQMNIQIGDYSFTATLEDNSSAEALKEYLSDGPVTLSLEDYAGMEKVGNLGTSLPRNDKQMNTSAGDIILYQGRSFVIYYGTNSWSLTRLGRIDHISADELKEALGIGNVEVTLSLQ